MDLNENATVKFDLGRRIGSKKLHFASSTLLIKIKS
jgi:hypothetical protein